MRINKDITEYCLDLYTGYMAFKNKNRENRDVKWDMPKQTKTESK